MVSEQPRRDERVALLVAEYSDRLNQGERLDLDAIQKEHPDLFPDLEVALEAMFDLETSPSAPARTRLGEFELIRELGRGGMGVVYEARQESVDRSVALKVLPPGLVGRSTSLKRFMREARAIARLHHPNIVSVYGASLEFETPYYTMELVKGKTLAELLEHWRDETPSKTDDSAWASPPHSLFWANEIDLEYCLDIARAFSDTAFGLHHAHNQGILHRDLKPSNLVLDGEGRLRILDFGLAHMEGEELLTQSEEILGTPVYMSPEQIRCDDLDARADIYGLGASLYEALTWHPPFKASSYTELLHRVLDTDPVSPCRLKPRIPRDLETIVTKCLEKRKDRRYATAEALAQDLARFVRGDPVEARPRSRMERLSRFLRARAKMVGLTALILLLTMALVYFVQRSASEGELRKRAEYEPRVLDAVMKIEFNGQPIQNNFERFIDADWFFDSAQFMRYHSVESAILELDRAIKDVPEVPDAYYHRARARALLGRFEGAIEDLNRALARDSQFLPCLLLRAELHEREGRDDEALRDRMAASGHRAGTWAETWYRAHLAVEESDWRGAAQAYSQLIEIEKRGARPYIGFSVEARLGRGMAQFNGGRFDLALKDFIIATELWSHYLEPHFLLGKTYYLDGRPERAEDVFREIHAQNPDDEVRLWVTTTYREIGIYPLDPRHPHDGDLAYSRGLEWANRVEDPGNRHRSRAAVLVDAGHHEEAIKAGERAIEVEPLREQSFMTMAYVYLSIAGFFEFDRAVINESAMQRVAENFKRAYELNPSSPHAQLGYGRTLLAMKQTDRALELLHASLRDDARNDTSYCMIGEAYESRQDWTNAEDAYRKALAISPILFPAHDGLGRIALKKGELDRALEHFKESLACYPEGSMARKGLATIHMREDDVEGAIEIFQELCQEHPDNLDFLERLGDALVKTGNEREATEAYSRMLELGSTEAQVLGKIGRSYYRQSRLIEAVGMLRTSLEIDPSSAEHWQMLARAQEKLGRNAEAALSYRQAAEWWWEEEQTPEAVEALRQALTLSSRKSTAALDRLDTILSRGGGDFDRTALRETLRLMIDNESLPTEIRERAQAALQRLSPGGG